MIIFSDISHFLTMYRYYMLVGGLEHEFYFSIQLGMSSSQLVIFFRGRVFPTNQYDIIYLLVILTSLTGKSAFPRTKWTMASLYESFWPISSPRRFFFDFPHNKNHGFICPSCFCSIILKSSNCFICTMIFPYYIHIRTIFSSHFSWLRPRRPHVAQDLSPEARIELLEARGPHGTGGADEQKVAKMWS